MLGGLRNHRKAGPCISLARSGILALPPLCAREQSPEDQGLQTGALLSFRSRTGSQIPTSPELVGTVRNEGTVLHSAPACVCLLRVWLQYCQILQFFQLKSETLTFMSVTSLFIYLFILNYQFNYQETVLKNVSQGQTFYCFCVYPSKAECFLTEI